jgi:hypothetical protein
MQLQDIAAGRKENTVMPFAETIKVMKIMESKEGQGSPGPQLSLA